MCRTGRRAQVSGLPSAAAQSSSRSLRGGSCSDQGRPRLCHHRLHLCPHRRCLPILRANRRLRRPMPQAWHRLQKSRRRHRQSRCPKLPGRALPSPNSQLAHPLPPRHRLNAEPPASAPTATTASPDVAALARARQLREKRDQEARARAAAEQQRLAEQERQRREAEIARKRADNARQRAAMPQPATPPLPVPPAARTASVQTVEQLCAGRSNFISTQLCQVRACKKPEFAADPICVKFKEFENTNSRRGEQ